MVHRVYAIKNGRNMRCTEGTALCKKRKCRCSLLHTNRGTHPAHARPASTAAARSSFCKSAGRRSVQPPKKVLPLCTLKGCRSPDQLPRCQKSSRPRDHRDQAPSHLSALPWLLWARYPLLPPVDSLAHVPSEIMPVGGRVPSGYDLHRGGSADSPWPEE